MSLRFRPGRKPFMVQERLLSFLSVDKVHSWPQGPLAKMLSLSQCPNSLPQEAQSLLLQQGLLTKDKESSSILTWADLEWNNVFAPLEFADFRGGFKAEDIHVCKGCLMRRYLAGRRASPLLYLALRDGHTVELPTVPRPLIQDLPGVQSWSGEEVVSHRVLPVPGCPHCWPFKGTIPSLNPGLFQPLLKTNRSGYVTSTHLPELVWLSGFETVGGGASWGEDSGLTKLKSQHEALERYAAHFERTDLVMTNSQGREKSVDPKAVFLTRPGSVSTGLACRSTLDLAFEDGLREVCERDALARFWLKLDAGNSTGKLLQETNVDGANLQFIQLDSKSYPTVVVFGRDGQGRRFSGSACAPTAEAKDKARSEALHNLKFLTDTKAELDKSSPSTFEEHALYYWRFPQRFPEWSPAMYAGVEELEAAKTWSVDITTQDVALYDLTVVRVLIDDSLRTPMSHSDWSKLTDQPPSQPHPFA